MKWLVAVLVGCMLLAGNGMAVPTELHVRVISKGAKFIGTSMGGVEIVVRDAATGAILAQGKTAGSTGDTDRIMKTPDLYHSPASTTDAAVFRCVLDLNEPRQIEVSARGPLAQPQAINQVSATQWMVPGKPIVGGDAFVLQMPGFIVDVSSPPAHIKLTGVPQTIHVQANVTLMCGCPIEPDGPWLPEDYEVTGLIYRDAVLVGSQALEFSGETSQYETELELPEPGNYEIAVYAWDPANGNTGIDRTTVVVKSE